MEEREVVMRESIERLAIWLCESSGAVVFTGAGVSTESGIPDFRSPGGFWERFDPEEFSFQRFLAHEEARRRYWEMSSAFYRILAQAEPNDGHRSIAELARLGRVGWVVTQNVDGLHQKAGSREDRVIELHGTALQVSCLSCGRRYDRLEIQERIDQGIAVPRCDGCGGLLKPATISFGQSMPARETGEAFRCAEACDLFLVVGSSLVVQPAASLPVAAKQAGARLAIVNRDPTALDGLADMVVRGAAGSVLNALLRAVKDALPRHCPQS
jgi:NAD-dependent deacetylase